MNFIKKSKKLIRGKLEQASEKEKIIKVLK